MFGKYADDVDWIHLAQNKTQICCEHGYEPSGFIKGGEILKQFSDYQLLKKDSVPWS
jgi:hypothetical protein